MALRLNPSLLNLLSFFSNRLLTEKKVYIRERVRIQKNLSILSSQLNLVKNWKIYFGFREMGNISRIAHHLPGV